MNVRLGFARIARVAAFTYLALSLVVTGMVVVNAWRDRQDHLHPHAWTVKVTDGRSFTIPATFSWEAQNAAELYASQHPTQPLVEGQTYSYEEVFAWEKPTRLTLPEYDHPPTLGSVFWKGLVCAFWLAFSYCLLWVVFRALRWIVLGFLTPALGVERR
jgi:hypothetical protein